MLGTLSSYVENRSISGVLIIRSQSHFCWYLIGSAAVGFGFEWARVPSYDSASLFVDSFYELKNNEKLI